MNYPNRRYLIIPSSIIEQINFTEVLETSIDTLRFSTDGMLTFVKYDLPHRPAIYSTDYYELTHTEMVKVLSTEDWTG
jgi:hypothetical protein